MQASFTNAKLHNADWTRSLIGEYPALIHDSPVLAVATHGDMIVTSCEDGKIRIWKNDQVEKACFDEYCFIIAESMITVQLHGMNAIEVWMTKM